MRKIQAKRIIAKTLKRTLNVRDYPYTNEETTDPKRLLEMGITRGWNQGLAFALALLVLEESK